MKKPIKISPDKLKDAIVEIGFESEYPIEVIIGMIFHSLDNTYYYTNRPLDNKTNFKGSSLFYNNQIKLLITKNFLTFNILNKYIGWEEYKKEIEKVLTQITKKRSPIIDFVRASVRFISEHQNINISDSFKFNFSFGMPNIVSDVYSFRSEFKQDDLNVFLNIQSNIRTNQSKNINISIIDIDVLNNVRCNTCKEIIQAVSIAHEKQKDIFFSLIKEDYLKTLNPIY